MPIECGCDLAGDGDHGDGVHVGIGDSGDEIGGTRTGGGHADADFARGARVAIRSERGGLFVAHENMANFGIEQRVVHRHDCAAGIAEDDFDTLAFEGFHQKLCAFHLRPLAAVAVSGFSQDI